jgi:hypothetical protein
MTSISKVPILGALNSIETPYQESKRKSNNN